MRTARAHRPGSTQSRGRNKMANLERRGPLAQSTVIEGLAVHADRETGRALKTVRQQTVLRTAEVRAVGIVQGEKLAEIDYLAETAMTGQAMLHRWAGTLAGDDVQLYDELNLFSDLARVGKGQILARTIDSYSRDW